MTFSSTPGDRLAAYGTQLITVHDRLRDDLDDLRENVASYLSGESSVRPRDLTTHCLTFCSALTVHHTGEDETAFPAVGDEFPELAKVLEKLTWDHNRLAYIMGGLENLVSNLPVDPTPEEARRIEGELNGLTAIMTSHFAYEERQLVAVLNKLRVPAWEKDLPAFLE